MNIYNKIEEVPHLDRAVVTMGNFDGVHLGHVHVLESLVALHEKGFQSVVITFWPHPKKVLNDALQLRFLTSPTEKAHFIGQVGIQHLLVLPFTPALAEMTAEDFVQTILVDTIGVKKIVLGYDHRFGKNREGGLDFLAKVADKYEFDLREIPQKEVQELGISSSVIREDLEGGKPLEAARLLGRLYSLSGTVVEGKKLGRTIGFPTANIALDFTEKLIPKNGVYAVLVLVEGKRHKGMMNIGVRPTVSGTGLTLEVNIFDLNADLYGQTIVVEFVKYIREEQKFANIEALIAQLGKDKVEANETLEKFVQNE